VEVDRARYLVSAEGRIALDSFAALDTADPVRLGAALRKSLAAPEAAAIAEQLTLRARAKERFGDDTAGMLFTATGLEMMTHPAVAARRAERLAAHNLHMVDLACGIGGDLRELAARGAAFGMERDAATTIVAAANIPAAGIVRGDATTPPFDQRRAAVLVDPSRRSGIMRTFDPNAFSPPWDVALNLARSARAGVIKGPPGIPSEALPPEAEVEFVQLGRSLRESALWFGDGSSPGLRRAVLLPAGVELTSDCEETDGSVMPPGAFLIDPESCVTRAGLVRQLGALLDAHLMDRHVAYLAANRPRFHPMAATFEVLERLDFSVAKLKAALRANRWRPDEIRRRAFPVEPDELRKLLGRIEGEPVTVLCTTLGGQRTCIVARRLRP
jgi:hypothetical protein